MKLSNLHNIYGPGTSAYIVGKGPSLAYLTTKYFTDSLAPVICLNDSIAVVQDFNLPNPLYSLQKDGNKDHMIEPDGNPVLILQNTEGYSRDFFPKYPKRVLIEPEDLGFNYPQVMAILLAIRLARYMAAHSLILLCCDSLTENDYRTYNFREKKSAETVAAKWYRASRLRVLREIKRKPYRLITPKENNVS